MKTKVVQHWGTNLYDTEHVLLIMSKGCNKVGVFYTQNTKQKLKDLRQYNPREIIVLGILKAGQSFKNELHYIFKDKLSHGNWYNLAKEDLHYLLTIIKLAELSNVKQENVADGQNEYQAPVITEKDMLYMKRVFDEELWKKHLFEESPKHLKNIIHNIMTEPMYEDD